VVVADAPEAAEDAPAVDEGVQTNLAPVHSMGLSEGAYLRNSRDAPDRGLARPAAPQPSKTNNSHIHDPPILIFLIKPDSKFSNIIHEYVMEPNRIFKLNARMGKRDDLKCVEDEDKSNLKTLL
ncbi:hypothetical protein Tco_0113604, partial [Tanacetum coccineum]